MAKPGRNGRVNGNWGHAETEITTDACLDDLRGELLPEVKAACHNSIKDMSKITKMGNIIDINIQSINHK